MTPRGDRVTANEVGTQRNGCVSTQKKCELCGTLFACGAPQSGCWCEGMDLSPDVARKLREQFADCLCPDCLAAAAVKG